MNNTIYYMVHRRGTHPKIEHNTLDEAKAEAERLARAFPGTDFYVLQAIRVFSTAQPEVVSEWCQHTVRSHSSD